MSHAGERVTPFRAQLIGNIFIASRERDWLKRDRLHFVDVLCRELNDLTNGIVVDAVDDRDNQSDFDANARQIFNRLLLYIEQIAHTAMFVLLFTDAVELQIDTVLTGGL